MTKCKNKNCPNQVEEGKKYCKYHQSKREDYGRKLLGLAVMGGIGLFSKIKK